MWIFRTYETRMKTCFTFNWIIQRVVTLSATAYLTGCASMNCDVKPVMSASTTESGQLDAMAGAGLVMTAKDKSVTGTGKDPLFHGGFWNEAGQTLVGPFHIYRSSDRKWMPEWKEHPVRTTVTTVLYAGAIATAASGGGGGGGSSSESTTAQPSGSGHSDPAPSSPSPSTPVTPPSDGGSSGGSL